VGITNICDLLGVGTNQRYCAVDSEQWQQRRQQRSRTATPLARQGCVTGVVVVIIIVSVTGSAYVAAAVPGHVIAVAAVVAGATPLAALIIVFPIVGRMHAPPPPPPPLPMWGQCTASSTPPQELKQSGRITVRRR